MGSSQVKHIPATSQPASHCYRHRLLLVAVEAVRSQAGACCLQSGPAAWQTLQQQQQQQPQSHRRSGLHPASRCPSTKAWWASPLSATSPSMAAGEPLAPPFQATKPPAAASPGSHCCLPTVPTKFSGTACTSRWVCNTKDVAKLYYATSTALLPPCMLLLRM